MAGEDVVRDLARHGEFDRTTFVLMTGRELMTMPSGFHERFWKPIDFDAIGRYLERIDERGRTRHDRFHGPLG